MVTVKKKLVPKLSNPWIIMKPIEKLHFSTPAAKLKLKLKHYWAI